MKTTGLQHKISSILHCVLLIGVLFSVVLCNPDYSSDDDMWWHLKYGEHFVKSLTWHVDHSEFSWSPSNADWKYVSWLGDILMFGAFKIYSFPGLYSIQILLILAVCGMYLYYLTSVRVSFNSLHVLAIFLVIYSIYSTHVKPEIFSVFLFAVVVFVFFISKTFSKSFFYVYPFLFFFWVNINGAFIFGILLIVLLLSLELLNFILLRKNPLKANLLKRLALSVALSFLALLINPYGIDYHLGIVHDLFLSSYMKYAGNTEAYMHIWRDLLPSGFAMRMINLAWYMVIMMAIFTLMNAYVFIKTKKIDITIIVLNILFFIISMSIGRAKFYFPLIWLFSTAYLYSYVSIQIDSRPVIKYLAVVIVTYFSAINIYNTFYYYPALSWFGKSKLALMPENEVAFINNYHLKGPFINDFSTGGYVIWSLYPEYKVFIDSRYGPYAGEVLDDWADFESNPTSMELHKISDKYGFRAVLINLKKNRIIHLLSNSPDWKLVYFDKAAAVIIDKAEYEAHASELDAVDLSPSRFKYITDPNILTTLFWTYAMLYKDIKPLDEILKLYENNVRHFYALRMVDIETMRYYIQSRRKQSIAGPNLRERIR